MSKGICQTVVGKKGSDFVRILERERDRDGERKERERE